MKGLLALALSSMLTLSMNVGFWMETKKNFYTKKKKRLAIGTEGETAHIV
jgi:hypothetical protein